MRGKRLEFTATLSRLDEVLSQVTKQAAHLEPELPQAWLEEMRLICSEIFSNICNYSGLKPDDRVRIVLYKSKQLVKIWFRDNGVRWYPEKMPTPNLDDPQEHGYGLYLIRALTDCFVYKRKEKRTFCNVTQFTKSIPHA
jgi:anti-sigma regulatory factor (Ser/Thr protein kinase)